MRIRYVETPPKSFIADLGVYKSIANMASHEKSLRESLMHSMSFRTQEWVDQQLKARGLGYEQVIVYTIDSIEYGGDMNGMYYYQLHVWLVQGD